MKLPFSICGLSPIRSRSSLKVLFASFKVGDVLEDRPTFTRLMIVKLAAYPRHRRPGDHSSPAQIKRLPSIAEMIEICNQLVGERRRRLGIVARLIEEREREQEKAELEARDVRLRE